MQNNQNNGWRPCLIGRHGPNDNASPARSARSAGGLVTSELRETRGLRELADLSSRKGAAIVAPNRASTFVEGQDDGDRIDKRKRPR